MPLSLPNLDDRSFDDLLTEARALIPSRAPQWTDHNPSDPGITLIEMFAYLAEMLIYRLNRVSDANRRAFVNLLTGGDGATADLDADLRNAVLALRRPDRTVTPADFEFLALNADSRVARAHCVPGCNLAATPRPITAVAGSPHLSVLVVPQGGGKAPDDLLQAVFNYLDQRRLLTSRIHVVTPNTLQIGVRLTLQPAADANPDVLRRAAVQALRVYFDPLGGGNDGRGWPFGRAVYVSEIYRLLAAMPGVDYVAPTEGLGELVVASADQGRLKYANPGGPLVEATLYPDELVAAAIDPTALTVPPPLRS